MNDIQELGMQELEWVAGGDAAPVVSGPGGSYTDNGSSCSPAPSPGATPALNANLGIRG